MAASTDQIADLLAPVLTDLATVVAGVRERQLPDPTPCTEFTVGQLRDHIVGWLATFAAGFADPDGQAPRASLEGYLPPPDAAAEVREAAKLLLAAVREGAADQPLRLGEAAMPGDLALSMILWEYLMHGWDLARATGQPWAPPEAATEASLAFAPGMLTEDYQGDGKPFAKPVPVPAEAPAFHRLLGLSGRDPGWQRTCESAPLIARFQVDSAQPQPAPGVEGDWVGVMTFHKTFTSGIVGTATNLFMSAGREEGQRAYAATEQITGHTGDGREGSVVVQHGGLESAPDTWFGHIVPGTGTGPFEGWAGSARIAHDDQGAYFEIKLA